MMDAISAPRMPATDGSAATAGSGRADKAADDSSFSKVLSKSGEQEAGASRQDRTRDETDASDADVDQPIAKTGTRAGERSFPAIDEALLAQLDALPDDISTGDLIRALAKAQGKGNGNSQGDKEPQVEIEGLDPQLKAQLAKAMAAVRDRKETGEGEPAAAEQAAGEATAPETPVADLADVLQLLAGGKIDPTDKGQEPTKGDKAAKDEQKVLPGNLADAKARDAADSTASDDDRSDGDRDFRFVRADGKGQPLVLRGEAASSPEQAEQKAVETVTVVDSRRYIAPVSTSNAASITAAMLGDNDWLGAMAPGSELANAAAQSSQGKVVHTLKLQMTPIDLGSVTATLRLSGEELSVQLTVDNAAAFRQLSNDQSDILKALRAQGLVVDQVQVTMQTSSADRSADAGQNGSQNQQTGQQTFQPGNQGGERQQRGDAPGNTVRMADERVADTTDVPASGNRGARPDQ
ncbi:MAG: flagellar hook-length control protein FliK, partial [Allorhizobium sp.]